MKALTNIVGALLAIVACTGSGFASAYLLLRYVIDGAKMGVGWVLLLLNGGPLVGFAVGIAWAVVILKGPGPRKP